MRTAPMLLLVLLVGCSSRTEEPMHASGAEALWGERRPAECRMVLSRPTANRLLRVAMDGTVTEEGPCPSARCILGAEHVVLTPDPLDPARVRALYDDGHVIGLARVDSRILRDPFPGLLTSGSSIFMLDGHDAAFSLIDRSSDDAAPVAMPTLAPHERLLGVKVTDDAVYLRLGPLRPAPAQLPRGDRWVMARDGTFVESGAPVVVENRLCGVVESDGAGSVLVRPDGVRAQVMHQKRVEQSKTDVSCFGNTVSFISSRPTFVERVDLDTLKATRVVLPNAFRAWTDGETIYALHPTEGFFVVEGTERAPLLLRRPGADLAGAPVPDGYTLERVDFVAKGTHVLVLERFRTPMCELVDLVHLADLSTRNVKTVRGGYGLRVAPESAAGAFWLVESDQETSTVE
jgi:hypothetical protein